MQAKAEPPPPPPASQEQRNNIVTDKVVVMACSHDVGWLEGRDHGPSTTRRRVSLARSVRPRVFQGTGRTQGIGVVSGGKPLGRAVIRCFFLFF